MGIFKKEKEETIKEETKLLKLEPPNKRKLKEFIEATPEIFIEFEDRYFKNDETNQVEAETKNMQVEIDKFEDEVDIYQLIEKYESGDLLAIERKKDIYGREMGQTTEAVDLSQLPKDINDYSELLKQIEELKAEVEKNKKQDLETATAKEITETVINNNNAPKEGE
nr:MAG: internal scaffolding protein [Microvirus Sku122]